MSGGRFRLSAAIVVLTLVSTLVATVPASAAQPTQSGSQTPQNQMTPKQWAATRTALAANHYFVQTVTVAGGTRTITFTPRNHLGVSYVLQEPAGLSGGGVTPMLGVGGCGWFQLCIYFNRNDLTIISSGGGAYIDWLICLGGVTTPACPVALILTASALAFISTYGICSNNLQIEVAPWPDAPWQTGCV
jgi:hypothetical protein